MGDGREGEGDRNILPRSSLCVSGRKTDARHCFVWFVNFFQQQFLFFCVEFLSAGDVHFLLFASVIYDFCPCCLEKGKSRMCCFPPIFPCRKQWAACVCVARQDRAATTSADTDNSNFLVTTPSSEPSEPSAKRSQPQVEPRRPGNSPTDVPEMKRCRQTDNQFQVPTVAAIELLSNSIGKHWRCRPSPVRNLLIEFDRIRPRWSRRDRISNVTIEFQRLHSIDSIGLSGGRQQTTAETIAKSCLMLKPS